MSPSDARTGPAARPFATADRSRYCSSISNKRCSNSCRSAASRRWKPKKSSARRKKPRWVRFDQVSRSAAASCRCAASVPSCATSAAPTVGRLAAAAIPSSSVDFPEPFSPTKQVTRADRSSRGKVRIAGTEKGNAASSPAGEAFFRLTARRWGTRPIDGTARARSQRCRRSVAARVQCEVHMPAGRIALLATLAVFPAPAVGQAAAGDSVVYRLSPVSRLDVKTGKAGLFGFAGHEHLIRARGFSGRVVYFPGAPALSRIEITVRTDSLEVLTPPDTEEIRKVTEAMRTDILKVDQYPEITLASKRITPSDGEYRIDAELTIVGQTRELSVEVRVEIGQDTLRAVAAFAVKQTDFGIKPFRGGPAGMVRVADRVTFDIEAVAVRDR